MKTTCVLLFFGLMVGSSFAQSVTIPRAAKDDLKMRFPGVTAYKWEVGRNGYEAEWMENGREVAVVYDAQGKYLMTEREISLDELPKAVRKGIKRNYPNAIPQSAELQSHPNRADTYEVEIHVGCVWKPIYYDLKGKEIKEGTEGSGTDGSEGNDGSDGSQEE